jgi:hypothetical protein
MTRCIPASAKQTLAAGRFSPLVPPLHGSDFYGFYCFRLSISLFDTLDLLYTSSRLSAEFLVIVTTAVFLLWLKVLSIPKIGS